MATKVEGDMDRYGCRLGGWVSSENALVLVLGCFWQDRCKCNTSTEKEGKCNTDTQYRTLDSNG